MSSIRYTSKAMPAFKLMAAENEYHRRNEILTKEIRKLRGEVGVLAKRFIQAKKEISKLITKVKSQPPPTIPERMERKYDEEKKEDEDTVMEEAENEEKEKEELERRRIEDIVNRQAYKEWIERNGDIGTEEGENEEKEEGKPEKDSKEAAKEKPEKEKEPELPPVKLTTLPPARKPISPLPVPPPPPPSPSKNTKIQQAPVLAGQTKKTEHTITSKPNAIAKTVDTSPTVPPPSQDEIIAAAKRVQERHDKWNGWASQWHKKIGSREGKLWYSYQGQENRCTDIGQWALSKRTELTFFDYWRWMCVKKYEGKGVEAVGIGWLKVAEKVKKEGIKNQVYR